MPSNCRFHTWIIVLKMCHLVNIFENTISSKNIILSIFQYSSTVTIYIFIEKNKSTNFFLRKFEASVTIQIQSDTKQFVDYTAMMYLISVICCCCCCHGVYWPLEVKHTGVRFLYRNICYHVVCFSKNVFTIFCDKNL